MSVWFCSRVCSHVSGSIDAWRETQGRRHSRRFQQVRAVAQTGQVLGVLNRSGNVHDSNGAKAFVRTSTAAVRAVRRRRTLIKVRVDSVFFGDEILTVLEHAQVRFTISVPFGRFLSLEEIIELPFEWQPVDRMREAF